MVSNVFFITIDQLRADRCFGENKTSKIPNLSNLMTNGVYFSKNFVPVAQTMTSLLSIFTGLYQIKSKNNKSNFNKNQNTFFDFFKNSGFHLSCCVPDVYFLKDISKKFDDVIIYPYVDTSKYVHIDDGLGDKIILQLEKLQSKTPWVFYTHLMDLKDPSVFSKEFDDEKYGDTYYERNISALDAYLGKILEKIDFSETLVIVSSDHGQYLPITGKNLSEISSLTPIINNLKNSSSFLIPIGRKVYPKFQNIVHKTRKRKLDSNLSSYESRSFTNGIDSNLYDEILNTPLIFTGLNIPKDKILNDLVKSVDIFPTIIDILQLKKSFSKLSGRSLLTLIHGEKLEEQPTYLQSPIYPEKLNETVGLRTSKYKYFRNRENNLKNVHLYDLENDPKENSNLAKKEVQIIKKMENMLNNIIDQFNDVGVEEFSDDELQKIQEELKKLGYLR